MKGKNRSGEMFSLISFVPLFILTLQEGRRVRMLSLRATKLGGLQTEQPCDDAFEAH